MEAPEIHQNHEGFSTGKVLLMLFGVAVAGITGWYIWRTRQATDATLDSAATTSNHSAPPKTGVVTNFDDCVKAGHPVEQTSPETCSANGKTYTQQLKTAIKPVP